MNKETKRTEKLASALYLLTSFFDDKEPMKWRLRELAGKFVARGEGSHVLEVMSLLVVAKNAGLISDTNFEIIHSQLALVAPQKIEDILTLEAPTEERRPISTEKPESRPERASLYLSSSVHTAPAIKDKSSRPEPRTERESRESGVVAMKKNSRQTAILNLLKKKKEIQVADVTPLITGVSEKTIQRELLAMVSKGILRKEGEKRWSRYSLAEE